MHTHMYTCLHTLVLPERRSLLDSWTFTHVNTCTPAVLIHRYRVNFARLVLKIELEWCFVAKKLGIDLHAGIPDGGGLCEYT